MVFVSKSRSLSGMSSRPVTPSGPGSAWDYGTLNEPQFVQLVELFLGVEPESQVFQNVAVFLRENYTETAEERALRLEQARLQAWEQQKRQLVKTLFELWDNDCSGYLDMEELKLVLRKWRGFSTEEEAEKQAEEILSSWGGSQNRLTRLQLQSYIAHLTEHLEPVEFEEFIEFLITSIKLTFDDRKRGERRQKLLEHISLVGKTSGLRFIDAMKASIPVIQEDCKLYGDGKEVSVAMGVMEETHLSYKAASSKCHSAVVGKKLYRHQAPVSFQAVDTMHPVHVPSVQNHDGIYYFRYKDTSQCNGSLVVVPIINLRQQVVGAFSVDTASLVERDYSTSFCHHEINFYQGIGVCLGEVHHWILARENLVNICKFALAWILRRCPQIVQAEMYLVEPPEEEEGKGDYTLRKMLTTTHRGVHTSGKKKDRLKSKDNLFREYLFQCVDNSEPVSAEAYGTQHLVHPLRDHTGCAVSVVDFSLDQNEALPSQQAKTVTKVLKLITMAYNKVANLAANVPNEENMSVLFDQLMLAELRSSVKKLNTKLFAELRSYVEPPPVIKSVLLALLYILYPDKDFDSWTLIKKHITIGLLKAMDAFDPFSEASHPKLGKIEELIEAISIDAVIQQGSVPAKFIHGWVIVCASLLQHSSKLAQAQLDVPSLEKNRENRKASLLKPMANGASIENAPSCKITITGQAKHATTTTSET